MRIDVDEELEKQLDALKREKWLSGKGHTETVRFLMRHYKETVSIEKLIEAKLNDMNERIEKSFVSVIKNAISKLFNP